MFQSPFVYSFCLPSCSYLAAVKELFIIKQSGSDSCNILVNHNMHFISAFFHSAISLLNMPLFLIRK